MIRTILTYVLMPFLLLVNSGCRSDADIQKRPPNSKATANFTLKGKHYELVDGMLFDENKKFIQHVYDPDFERKYYATENGRVYRLISGGKTRLPVFTRFNEDFENASSIRDLISEKRGWSTMTLVGPKTRNPEAYNQLRNHILQKRGDFLDNRVEPSSQRFHSGTQSLRTYAIAGPRNMDLLKASISNELFHFTKGDRVEFSGWFFLEKGIPTSLVDIESSYIDKGSGIRLMLDPNGRPRVELKWPTRPTYNAPQSVRIRTKAWTHIELTLDLSENSSGHVQLVLDGKKVIDTNGQTLPLADAVLDRLEVGITSTPTQQETILFVDDLSINQTRN